MANRVEMTAALNMILARLSSEPETSEEWATIADHLQAATAFALKETSRHLSIEFSNRIAD